MVSLKKIVKLFIPPIVLSLYHKLITPPLPQPYTTIHQHKKEQDIIFILGNGPSLKHQLESYLDFLSLNICICVNSFVLTDFYYRIKPKIYILMDPVYFVNCAVPEIEEENISVFDNLFSKTNWKIDLVVSSFYRNNDRLLSLKENQNINILYVNQEDCKTYHSKDEQFQLFNENMITIPAHNVLNTAVYLSIFWRYSNIILLGADTSFHEEIKIDQETNMLFTNAQHFYGFRRKNICRDAEQTMPFKINEFFHFYANVFDDYLLLREYANYNSVKVFNASSYSYIDAFERKDVDEFIAI